MKKTNLLIALLLCFTASAQLDNTFGIKAGTNYSQFRPDIEFYGEKVLDFQGKIGYYIGGFFNIRISDKTSIRPELLLANQGTKTSSEFYMEFFDDDPMVGKVVTKVNELMILVPVNFRIELVERLYLELGMQPGYAVKRTEVAKKVPFDPSLEGEKDTYSDFDRFDFGLNGGLGFDLTNQLELNLRYNYGLIERDNTIKTSVISLGLGFKI
ncbi:outer membrane beta-barrel protein [Muricauda sp. HICW]|uniref:Outer membrane beta-barrel protein n=1 Tax=Flagellimonas chongwuensis TaxID=2697365 RepID=A0A850NCL5_9FLAO|nr:porin family protein [Allomuricauda chongwuensis]NVN17649.1 outer membrane beta-barrel protein [Allomuricauda chongwuensis]